jgi:hypothetical protein
MLRSGFRPKRVPVAGRTWLLAGVALAALAARPAAAAPTYQFEGTIAVPTTSYNTTGTFIGYDLSTFDASDGLYYLTDRSNNAVDVFSAKTNSFVTYLGLGSFAGNTPSSGSAGPNGISITTLGNGDHLLLAGNSPSNFVEFNLAPDGTTVLGTPQTISTAVAGTPVPQNRVDGVAYSPTANTVLAANNASNPGFITLVNNANGAVIRSLLLDGANGTPNVGGNGVEATIFNTVRNSFFVAVPALTAAATDAGGVIEVSATTGQILNTYDFDALGLGASGSCSPTGMAQGAGGTLVVACSVGGTQSIILDPTGKGSIRVIAGTSGSDELTYDPTNGLAFEADRFQVGGSVLGIVDTSTAQSTQNLPISYNAHSVAVDPVSGEVFVALDASSGTNTDAVCPSGCIGVFGIEPTAVPEPATLPVMAMGLIALGVGVRRRS